jgi:hypothetical protein
MSNPAKNTRNNVQKEARATAIRNTKESFNNVAGVGSRKQCLLRHPPMKSAGSMEATPGASTSTTPVALASKDEVKAAILEAGEGAEAFKAATMEAVAWRQSWKWTVSF